MYSIRVVSKCEIRTETKKNVCFTALILCKFVLITRNVPYSVKGSIFIKRNSETKMILL